MISILTPSRSRPQLARRMYESAVHRAGRDIEVKFYLNDDDPMLADYLAFLKPDQYMIGPNQSTSYSWNLMAEQAQTDIFFLVGDDAQFATNNWANIVLQTFAKYPDGIACVYPRVPTLSRKKCPHFCLHRNWTKAVGFFLPPHFYHWYVDTWIREVAQRVGRFHCMDNFEMPIENIRDEVNRTYHHSWQRQRDDWMWDRTVRYREADAASLLLWMENYNYAQGRTS